MTDRLRIPFIFVAKGAAESPQAAVFKARHPHWVAISATLRRRRAVAPNPAPVQHVPGAGEHAPAEPDQAHLPRPEPEVLTSMRRRPWGDQAAENARRLGVTPVALAVTFALEMGEQPPEAARRHGHGTIAGVFQMRADAFKVAMEHARRRVPDLVNPFLARYGALSDANAVLAMQMDPIAEGIAAAQVLHEAAARLQANGIPNPTVLQARGYYQFGPKRAVEIAKSPPDARVRDNSL